MIKIPLPVDCRLTSRRLLQEYSDYYLGLDEEARKCWVRELKRQLTEYGWIYGDQ